MLTSRKTRVFSTAGYFVAFFLGRGGGDGSPLNHHLRMESQTAKVKISHTGLSGDVRVALGVHGLMCIMVSSRPYMDGLFSVELLSLRVILIGPLLRHPRDRKRAASSRTPF